MTTLAVTPSDWLLMEAAREVRVSPLFTVIAVVVPFAVMLKLPAESAVVLDVWAAEYQEPVLARLLTTMRWLPAVVESTAVAVRTLGFELVAAVELRTPPEVCRSLRASLSDDASD